MGHNTITAFRNYKTWASLSVGSGIMLAIFLYGYCTRFYDTGTWVQPISIAMNVLMLLLFSACLTMLIDKKPILIISAEGISFRKMRIPFSNLVHAPWSTIEFYHTKTFLSKGIISQSICIGFYNTSKEQQINIDSLSVSASDIMELVKYYAPKNGIRFSGHIKA